MVNKKKLDAMQCKLDDIRYEQDIDKNNIRIISRVVFFNNDNNFFYIFNVVLNDKIIK